MLDWVTGAPRSHQDSDQDADDAPETPAHVFAARAFKNLLFGTPAPKDTTVEKSKRLSRLNGSSKQLRRHSSDIPREKINLSTLQEQLPDVLPSPSKGILVAPGSISTKRKSVTFGSLGWDYQSLRNTEANKKSKEEEPVPTMMPTSSNNDHESLREDIRRSLFRLDAEPQITNALKEKGSVEAAAKDRKNEHNTSTVENTSSGKTSEPKIPLHKKSKSMDDRTVDLNQPRSTSGQHWKREYERDHDNSKAEMKKLIQYNQMTKSYAEKRDKDAIIVTQKLHDAEAKTRSLETKIRKLAGQLMDARLQGDEQDKILSEVASQTAEVMRQKGNAERYRATLRKYETQQGDPDDRDDIKKDADQSADMAELKTELLKVRLAVDRAEARAAKSDYDNVLLNTTLQKVREAKKDLGQEFDKLQSHLTNKVNRLEDENRQLNNALDKSKSECSSLRDEIQALKNAQREPANNRISHLKEKLFDVKVSRFTKEPSPPTSDEDLRQRKAPTSPRAPKSMVMPSLDFTVPGEVEDTYSQKRFDGVRRKSHKREISSVNNLSEPLVNAPLQHKRWGYNPPSTSESDVESTKESEASPIGQHPSDSISKRPSSPLMKSFVDNLGSRRVLPPERVAAAKKRLEEKAAARRSTPMYAKVQDKIIV